MTEFVEDPDPDATEDTLEVEEPGNWDKIPTAVWHGKTGCSPGGVVAYLALRRRATMRRRRPDCRRSTLAEDMDITVRAVDGRLDELIERGWLLITPRFRRTGDGGQMSNRYQLLWDPITSVDDQRLQEHLARVADFNDWMEEQQKKNVAAGKNAINGRRDVRKASWNPEKAVKP
ncbi:MAG TPA: hypothetical protein VFP72_00600, partial [Kineosporiaceae bacterium]|nr:hypothetical protein [Kineosporiaceae bacterium]